MRPSQELEARLTTMFREQADSIPVTTTVWPEAAPDIRGSGRSPRPPLVLAAAMLASVFLAVVLVGGGGQPERVTTGPAASSGAPPPGATGTPSAPFHVETRQVSLSAGAIEIETGGKQFVTAPPIDVDSDPGIRNAYTTLELTWQEHGVEMRLFVYFGSDGREWWSNEIRTYNGSAQGDWITYTGEFFRRPLGTPFVGDFTVATEDPVIGRLHISDMRLEAFRRPPACESPTGAFVLEPGTSPIVIEGSASGYGAGVSLLSAESCSPVPDQNRYRYEWRTSDASVVVVERSVTVPEFGERRAHLTPVGKGQTTVRVTARDPGTGVVVAEGDIEVIVGDLKPLPSAPAEQSPAVP